MRMKQERWGFNVKRLKLSQRKIERKTKLERERSSERGAHTHTHTHTNKHTHTQTYMQAHTHTCTDREREREKERNNIKDGILGGLSLEWKKWLKHGRARRSKEE